MKLNRRQLRRLILEEVRLLSEGADLKGTSKRYMKVAKIIDNDNPGKINNIYAASNTLNVVMKPGITHKDLDVSGTKSLINKLFGGEKLKFREEVKSRDPKMKIARYYMD